MAPGGLPEPPQERKRKWSPFLLLFLASWAALGVLLGRFWRLLGPSWRLLGRSWPLPGRSWGAFGPPGELFFELFGSLFGAFEKKHEKTAVRSVSRELFLVSFVWRFLCLAGHGGARARLEKHENHMVFTVYGACRPLARRAKTTRNNEENWENNQKTHRKTRAETALENIKK